MPQMTTNFQSIASLFSLSQSKVVMNGLGGSCIGSKDCFILDRYVLHYKRSYNKDEQDQSVKEMILSVTSNSTLRHLAIQQYHDLSVSSVDETNH